MKKRKLKGLRKGREHLGWGEWLGMGRVIGRENQKQTREKIPEVELCMEEKKEIIKRHMG